MTQRPRPRTAELLDLAPHPEGGWYRETWRAGPASHPDGYPGLRAAATGIYFLLAPGEESRWHRVRSDEVWLWHAGGPLLMLDGGDGDRPSGQPETTTLGPGLETGDVPQHVVPGGHWQAARPAAGEEVLVELRGGAGLRLRGLHPARNVRQSFSQHPSSGRPPQQGPGNPASDGKSPGNWLDIRQLTDVSACKLQQYLSRNWHSPAPARPRERSKLMAGDRPVPYGIGSDTWPGLSKARRGRCAGRQGRRRDHQHR